MNDNNKMLIYDYLIIVANVILLLIYIILCNLYFIIFWHFILLNCFELFRRLKTNVVRVCLGLVLRIIRLNVRSLLGIFIMLRLLMNYNVLISFVILFLFFYIGYHNFYNLIWLLLHYLKIVPQKLYINE